MIRSLIVLAIFVVASTLSAQNPPKTGTPKPLDPKWIAVFNSRKSSDEKITLLKEEMLKRNPLLQEFKPTIENEKIVGLEFSSRYVSDLTPLKVLREELTRLSCHGSSTERGILADLRPLEGMKLIDVDFSSNQLDDTALKVLAKMPIEKLRLRVNRLTTLTPVVMLHLNHLDVADNTRINALPAFPNAKFEEVNLSGTTVAKIDALKGHPLKVVNLTGTKIESITVLKGCLTIEDLRFSETVVNSLQPTAGMPLKTLHCGSAGDPRGTIDSIELLREMPLERVTIMRGTFKSLEPLKDKKLNHAIFGTNPNLTDLSPLKGMPLTILDIRGTKVSSLAPVEGMPLVEFFCSGCPISDLSPLKSKIEYLRKVNFRNLPITNLEGLQGGKLYYLPLEGCKDLKDLSALKDIETVSLSLQGVPVRDWSFLPLVNGLKTLEVDNPNDPKLKAVLKNLPGLKVSNGKK